ncbi:Histone acetyltransferase kat6a [Coelomomyces lativittatus]|nr:Histone acetyltransferase kat6a [Coelomomyces lativittatus]
MAQSFSECRLCNNRNAEITITCSACKSRYHQICLGFTEEQKVLSRTYNWLCRNCRRCFICYHKPTPTHSNDSIETAQLLQCYGCDRSIHFPGCLNAELSSNGRFKCYICLSKPLPQPHFPTHFFLELPDFHRFFNGQLTLDEANNLPFTPGPLDIKRYQSSVGGEVTRFPRNSLYRSRSRKNIEQIRIGNGLKIKTWYSAPYPEEYTKSKLLYLCPNCLKYMPSEFVMQRHLKKCPHHFPPGKEIYRDSLLSVFEVDGKKSKVPKIIVGTSFF